MVHALLDPPLIITKLNNNLKSTTDVTGSLQDFALSCEQGMTYFRTTNYTTDSPFPFSVGLIYRRNNDFKIVGYDLLGNGIKTNRKTGDMENWDGWHSTALKSDLVAGTAKFPKTSVGTQEIIIDFPYEMRTVPVVLVSWKDTAHIFEHMDGLVVTEIEKTRFKVASRRKIESYDWGFSYLAICR